MPKVARYRPPSAKNFGRGVPILSREEVWLMRKLYYNRKVGGMRVLARLFKVHLDTARDVLRRMRAYRYIEFSEREEKLFKEKWGDDPYVTREITDALEDNR